MHGANLVHHCQSIGDRPHFAGAANPVSPARQPLAAGLTSRRSQLPPWALAKRPLQCLYSGLFHTMVQEDFYAT